MENQTTVSEFILLGLSSDPQMQIFHFLLFLVIYLVTLVGNVMIMLFIKADPHLHTPMHFFLFHLSFVDICYSSVTVPNMLMNFQAKQKTISVNDCIAQIFFFLSAGKEILILSAMAYDRYAAICHPLHYVQTMNKGICVQLVSGAWTLAFLGATINTVFALKLHFCWTNQISHFSCELPLLLQLSCTEILINQVLLLTSTVILVLSSFLLTLISYIHIISTILRIRSTQGRHKAFSTCSSHLIVVCLLYLTALFQYIKPSSVSSVVLDEMFSVQYSILTPMLNLIIYSLKNKEVKRALEKFWGNSSFSSSDDVFYFV
ncbi:olfactory receptor 8S1-like [Trachemys scripta elegans]|uniref:olfactory receptor 8S1-like n=1 Tax=Trachemys scripta elegans TaxID=31138 RepID=UPI0015528ED2|nr:olfactory receptor 8S1-like [Trachemys scripta elegans]